MTEFNFIDLEQTVIDSWHYPLPINLQLKRQLAGLKVAVFSFALRESSDLNHFHINIRETLESVFGVKIVGVVLTADLCKMFMSEEGRTENYTDYMFELGKQELFLKYAETLPANSIIRLWDDSVSNFSIKLENGSIVNLYKV